jgi:hypothetical protein
MGVFLLSSCGPPLDGYAGVTVDSNGQAQALIQTCKHSMDGATIYWSEDPKGGDSDHALIGEWEFSRSAVGRPITWPVDADRAEGVRASVPIKTLVPGRTYSLYGWTKDNSWSSGSVDFTLIDLKTLKPGQVLILYTGVQPRVVSIQRFSDVTCDVL